MSELVIRPVREDDVEAIIHLDARATGERKPGFWRGHLAPYLAAGDPAPESLIPELCLVAVMGEAVVGFVAGDVQSWQFGLPRSGRVVAIAVDPDRRRGGVGRALVARLLEQFRKMELHAVRCVVRPGDDLDRFFEGCGLGPSEFAIRTVGLD